MILRIASLNLDFQPPECLFDETVHKYVTEFLSGGRIEPVEVYSDGVTHWLFDKFHRVAAARTVGIKEIEATITPGGSVATTVGETGSSLGEVSRS